MKIDFFKIKAAAPVKHSHPGFDMFVVSMEKLVRETIPESVIAIHETSHFIPVDSSFERLNESLPILTLSEEADAPCTLSLTVLTREENTHGVGLFLCDMIAQKLFPEKKMPISFARSLSFKFIVKPKQRYYIIEIFIEVDNLKELYAIKKNFFRFDEEIRLSILGVEKARKLVLAKGLTVEEKRMVLSENLESLIRKPINKALFSDVQNLLLKALYEHNPDKIPEHILPYIDTKPETFDHFIFKEMERLSILFHEEFAALRSLSHLTKTISYLYLFRKILAYTTHTKPNERHLSLKLLTTTLQNVPTLALLIGVNFIDPHEVLEVQDILLAVSSLVPAVKLVPGSNVIDEEEIEGIRLLYLEFQKKKGESFTVEDLKILKKRLPKEIKSGIQVPKPLPSSVDEEKMRSILSLSKELSSVHDPSEVIIQYHDATETHYHFSVILARVRKSNEDTLKLISYPPITIRKQERKVAGILDKRYVKEIYLYEMKILKKSRDIAKARADLFSFIRSHVYNLHDYSGGMVNRKYENLRAFKDLLEDPLHDSLIENYFYSISPPYLQSLTSPEVLKQHFELFLTALDKDFLVEQTHIMKKDIDTHTLVAIASTNESEIDRIRERVPLGENDIALMSLKVFDLHLLGLILPKSEARIAEILDDLALFV